MTFRVATLCSLKFKKKLYGQLKLRNYCLKVGGNIIFIACYHHLATMNAEKSDSLLLNALCNMFTTNLDDMIWCILIKSRQYCMISSTGWW